MAESPDFEYKPFPLTQHVHKRAYDAILPTRPELSQAGKTVLITGGSSGIGYGIAKAFAVAQAQTVIIVGRDQSKLDEAIRTLSTELADDGLSTKFEGRVCEISDPDSIKHLWNRLSADDIHVDVLVLNAFLGGFGPLSDLGWERVWKEFEVNVRAVHQFSDHFNQQPTSQGTRKYLLNVSSAVIHEWEVAKGVPSYSLTKNSAALLMQQIAREKESAETQIISFHPGFILTESNRERGFTEADMAWDNIDLPGAFAVWCAHPGASFLHGRWVWSAWDVNELASGDLRKRLDEDDRFLRIGVHGLVR